MENINSFNSGMNKDLSKVLLKSDHYLDAQNFSLVTDVGQSTGTLRNIKGNEWFINIPDCSNVVRLHTLTSVAPASVVISVSLGPVSFSITESAATLEDLGEKLQQNPLFANNNLAVAYTDTSIIIYGLLVNNILVAPILSVSTAGVSVDNNYVPFLTGLKIVGWGVVRDQIIIYTTSNADEVPVNKPSQIWNLTYDTHTDIPVIKLLYNGYLNLSLSYPIANPGAIVGNYETLGIQKIYWTDNYNTPKALNIANINAMALTPEQLELVPSLSKSVATVSKLISGGGIKTGIYQISGRLTSTTGSNSSFIIPSNPITVINEAEGTSVAIENYEARDTAFVVAKTVEGTIYNLDREFDRVEPVVIYKETKDSSPDVYILPSQPIPATGQYTFTYSGNETVIPISLEEFLAEGLVFDTVKTMASKNNMLFFGNVKYADFDVDFDARAYRFTNTDASNNSSITATLTSISSGSFVLDAGTNGAPVTPLWNSIPQDFDAIQTNDAQSPDGKKYHLWKADGVTFGGQGPNVSYEFVPMTSFNDASINRNYRVPLDTNGLITSQQPWASVDVANTVIDFDSNAATTYDQVNQYDSYFNSSSPYVSYGLKGYQRDETYRFGIVFFSKKGQPSYVHWIGDIRMPKPWMPSTDVGEAVENRNYLAFPLCSMDDGTGVSTNSPAALTGSLRNFYGNNLGIKFTVNVSSIRDQISGYSIVRVARTDSDKTVLGQGIYSPSWYAGFDGHEEDHYTIPGGDKATWASTPGSGGTEGFSSSTFGIASPEFLFKTSPTFVSGDQFDFIQVNEALYGVDEFTPNNLPGVPQLGDSLRIQKYYTTTTNCFAPRAADRTSSPNRSTPIPFNQSKVFKPGETFSFTTAPSPALPVRIRNFSYQYNISSPTTLGIEYRNDNGDRLPRARAGSRLMMAINDTFRNLTTIAQAFGVGSWKALSLGGYDAIAEPKPGRTIFGSTKLNENIYVVNYRRPTTVQYGGNSYSERSYNEYISTGHIQLIDATTATTNTSMVFGGDTYITLFDYGNQLRNAALYDQHKYDNGNKLSATAYYTDTRQAIHLVPVECSFPIELRKNNSKPSGAIDDGYLNTGYGTSAPYPWSRCAPNKAQVWGDWPNSADSNINGPYTTAEFSEAFIVNSDYFGDNDIVKFFPLPDPYLGQNKFDVRVHRSQIKTNGELVDSWSLFKPEDYIDVDTSQGELNNLIIYQNTLIGFQDKGVVQLSVRDRAITPDVSGSEIILGTGGILENYIYISKIIGSRHQFSFTTSHDAVFWFDMNTKNMYKMSGNAPISVTVAKGLSSYMNNNLNGIIQICDNPYLDKGITATYDFRYNEAIMTFKDIAKTTSVSFAGPVAFSLGTGIYRINVLTVPSWVSIGNTVVCYLTNNTTPYVGTVTGFTVTTIDIQFVTNPTLLSGTLLTGYNYQTKFFTVAYNDIIDGFTSFYAYTPSVYINDQMGIFSPDSSLNKIFRHDVGRHGVFYVDYINNPTISYTPAKSTVKLLVNPYPTETKVFDNYEMVTEVINLTTGANIVDDTFDRIRLYDDYQNTDFQALPIDNGKQTAKRKERTWNLSNLRNRVNYTTTSPDIFTSLYTSDQFFGERMRDKYLTVDLEYDNLNDYRLIMHTFKTHYRKSAR